MVKFGEVLFFKKAKKGTRKGTPELNFRGHAYAVFLGHVAPFEKDPTTNDLIRDMGKVGFIMFDDVGEFLGNVAGAECVKKFEDKYYGVPVTDPKDIGIVETQPELPIEPPKQSTILGIDGKPL